VFRVEHAGKHMNNRIDTVAASHRRPENKWVYGINRRYKLPTRIEVRKPSGLC
jgi:hypothetical protein